jgi:hypothetical protein
VNKSSLRPLGCSTKQLTFGLGIQRCQLFNIDPEALVEGQDCRWIEIAVLFRKVVLDKKKKNPILKSM